MRRRCSRCCSNTWPSRSVRYRWPGASAGLLGVQIVGACLIFADILLLLILTSLGLGFVIAAISSSEQQATQLVMLVLITSIFFSCFMIVGVTQLRPALLYLAPLLLLSHQI